MSKEKQAQLITEIGEMIVEDKTYQTKSWHSLAIAITLTDEEKMSGYLYQEDGTYEAGSPREFGDLLDKLLELKAEMVKDGDKPFLQCLIHITKPNYKIRLQFEYENPKRWTRKSTGMDMSAFANALKPE
ncbi:hypothetical protein SY27_16345 [Flavobacterium sp. 316]|uniref:hypothetical protein n=1 Tax=Flavobacterium sp. 316 TaxID=1603293 RepID=UPI0005E8D3D4|nr:hypothetical protein [Flavobacterium sp. 316]KIX20081.1 hypothetical protein SY27_16345 [Flavobacterium sp. 316]